MRHENTGSVGRNKKFSRIRRFAIIPVLAMCITTALTSTAEAKARPYLGIYTDVAETSWYWNFVESCNTWGLMNGYADGTFRPESYITRAECATILSRIAVDNSPRYEVAFDDVANTSWYYNAVSQFGDFMGGCTQVETTSNPWGYAAYFYPDALATREDFMQGIYIATAAGTHEATQNRSFLDASSINSEYRENIEHLYRCGVINGDGNGYFRPKDSITRAEVATILCTLAEWYWI